MSFSEDKKLQEDDNQVDKFEWRFRREKNMFYKLLGLLILGVIGNETIPRQDSMHKIMFIILVLIINCAIFHGIRTYVYYNKLKNKESLQ